MLGDNALQALLTIGGFVLLIICVVVVTWNHNRPPQIPGTIVLLYSNVQAANYWASRYRGIRIGSHVDIPHRARSQEEGERAATELALKTGAVTGYFKFTKFQKVERSSTC